MDMSWLVAFIPEEEEPVGSTAEHGWRHGMSLPARSEVRDRQILTKFQSARLQRQVDTDRVPNDGVSGPSYYLDDLTAALANLSKTLVEVIDRQTQYPDGRDTLVVFIAGAEVGASHFASYS